MTHSSSVGEDAPQGRFSRSREGRIFRRELLIFLLSLAASLFSAWRLVFGPHDLLTSLLLTCVVVAFGSGASLYVLVLVVSRRGGISRRAAWRDLMSGGTRTLP